MGCLEHLRKGLGHTYLSGKRVSLLSYYQVMNIPHKLCGICCNYYPYSAFQPTYRYGVKEWVCQWCARKLRTRITP